MRYIYLFNVEGTDIYKIGVSKNPSKRKSQVQTGCPYKIIEVDRFESEHFLDIETRLHAKYQLNKVDEDGRELQGEFFRLSKKERDLFIEDCRKSESIFIILEKNSYLANKKNAK